MKKQRTSWLACLLAALACVMAVLPVKAAEPPAETGSIRIVLEESAGGRSREGVELSIYHCADLIDGKLAFFEPYLDCAAETEELSKPSVVRETKEKLRKHLSDPLQSVRSDEEGIAVFEDLPLGLYMVRATDPAGYDQIGDLLICLPAYNEKEGTMEFNVSVFAKAIQIPDILIEKTDPSGTPITGKEFVFTSFEDEKTTKVRSICTGNTQNATCRFSINLNETLYIRETSAPAGFALSEAVIEVFLSEDGQLFVNKEPYIAKDGVFRIVCINQPKKPETKKTTPPTGAKTDRDVWMISFALSAVLLIWLAGRIRKA